MTSAPIARAEAGAAPVGDVSLLDVAPLAPAEALRRLGSSWTGLRGIDVTERHERFGDNAVGRRHAGPWSLLLRQVSSPLLGLLLVSAVVSFFVGQRNDAVVIGVILVISVGLGFINEYRSEQAAQALHSQITRRQLVVRDGQATEVDPVSLVPGDIVRLRLGDIVPADVRIVATTGLDCDESVLTGESVVVSKRCDGDVSGEERPSNAAWMGTIVRSGTADAVVVRIGASAEFGAIAERLGTHNPLTAFQIGLNSFSRLLAGVAGALTTSIFVINIVLGRPIVSALLFSLAIAIGITPQLLPAVVSVSLSTGSRRLAKRKVLVKRLVSIEDLGNIELLITDKTGTLTDGAVSLSRTVDAAGEPSEEVLTLARACTDVVVEGDGVVSGSALDVAVLSGFDISAAPWAVSATLPFDHERRLLSVVVTGLRDGALLITKGAPESVLERCIDVPPSAAAVLAGAVRRGSRVVAVATRPLAGVAPSSLDAAAERGLHLAGFVELTDPPKVSAGAAVARLASLGIDVRIATGDHPDVAVRVCEQLGVEVLGVLSGRDVDALGDAELHEAIARTTIFARVSPEQKARLVDVERAAGVHVAFLGDGVNDAVALHAADVGISVDSATEVAKDAADIVLLEKDLDVLADGVTEGRAIFANTIKYVLMATSSNFGNMFSAAAASAFMSFLPMLPSQILLNNLLYDVSEMTIPTDNVDEAQLQRPAHWDIGMIRRFMAVFGPISSLFDILTFVFMLRVLHAGQREFRAGWFVESLATQSLVIAVIRTQRSPFWRSRPSNALIASTLTCVSIGVVLPFSPFASAIGFRSLPLRYLVVLPVMIGSYLTIVELVKVRFFARVRNHPSTAHLHEQSVPLAVRPTRQERHVRRRASRLDHPLGIKRHRSRRRR